MKTTDITKTLILVEGVMRAEIQRYSNALALPVLVWPEIVLDQIVLKGQALFCARVVWSSGVGQTDDLIADDVWKLLDLLRARLRDRHGYLPSDLRDLDALRRIEMDPGLDVRIARGENGVLYQILVDGLPQGKPSTRLALALTNALTSVRERESSSGKEDMSEARADVTRADSAQSLAESLRVRVQQDPHVLHSSVALFERVVAAYIDQGRDWDECRLVLRDMKLIRTWGPRIKEAAGKLHESVGEGVRA